MVNYSNARVILPPALLRRVQTYANGLLWVPSPTRRRIKTAGDAARNTRILRDRARGRSIRWLARKYRLSPTRIHEIVSQPLSRAGGNREEEPHRAGGHRADPRRAPGPCRPASCPRRPAPPRGPAAGEGGVMILTLVGVGDRAAVPMLLWPAILTVAQQFGWKQAGTLPPLTWVSYGGTWPGDYYAACGQRVADCDARAFAAALQLALRCIPTAIVVPSARPEISGDWGNPVEKDAVDGGDVPSPLEALSGPENRALVARVARLAARGSFRIT